MNHRTLSIAALGIVCLDQFTKFLVQKFLTQPLTIIQHVLNFTYVQNTGASFGMLQQYGNIILWVNVIVIGLILFYYHSFKENQLPWVMLILAGAVGNFIDRIIYGHVIDFIDFKIWPVFNVADSAMTIGGIMLAYYLIKQK